MFSVTENLTSLFLWTAKAVALAFLILDYKLLRGMDSVSLIHLKSSIAPAQKNPILFMGDF